MKILDRIFETEETDFDDMIDTELVDTEDFDDDANDLFNEDMND